MNTIIERLKAPVPRLIKKVQKITSIIGGLGVVITGLLSLNPELHIPNWVWESIAIATIGNYLLLQATKPEDFKENGDTSKEG